MNKAGLHIVVLCLCMIVVQCAFAQVEQYNFRHLNVRHQVTSIFKDSRGFIWVGTPYGLNRFDGYDVRTFHHDARDTTSLNSDYIERVFETPDHKIGIVTWGGLILYNPETEKFEKNPADFFSLYKTSASLYNIVDDKESFWFVERNRIIKYVPLKKLSIIFETVEGDSSSILKDSIADFSIDSRGNHWIIHRNGITEKIEVVNDKGRVVQRQYALYNFNRGSKRDYQLHSDKDGDLWICAPGWNQGIFFYDNKNGTFHHFTTNSRQLQLNTNSVSTLEEGNDGMIWAGTDQGGINLIDKEKFKVKYIYHRDEDNKTLSQNTVTHLYRDDQGIIWAGTFKCGVSYYHPNIYRFDVYKHNSLNPSSLPFGDINRFAEDNKGNLWIGTNGGGLLYFDRQNNTFKQYKNDPENKNSLSGDVIVSLCVDSENTLWIGTFNHGLNKFDGKKFTRYEYDAKDTSSIPGKSVWEIFEDSKHRLWMGTLEGGAALIERDAGNFRRFKTGWNNAIRSGYIAVITEDHDGNIWFGTLFGIDVMSADGKTFTHYDLSSGPNSSSGNNILDIREDSKHRIWIGTPEGLSRFDAATKTFKAYKDNGLRNNTVLTIQEDNRGNIWMGTLNGLSKMTLSDDSNVVSIKQYTEADGLQALQFNENAAFKTRRGELVFGGPYGFNILNSEKFNTYEKAPNIVFTDFRLYQNSVEIGEKINGVVVLSKSISVIKEIVLPPHIELFSIEFSALDYFDPDKSQYMYKLDGLNSEWLLLDERAHKITFNRLNPGTYKLRLKAANNDGIWSDHEAVLAITILPPFWKTNTAFILYVALLVLVLFATRKLIQRREHIKFAVEHERQEIQRMRELDLMKIKFFTNVSHEFRTPLTLIMTPVESLIKKATDPSQKAQFELIRRNAKRLLNLVNQLLDFRKLEVNEVKFNPSEGDIIAFVKDAVFSFSDLSEKKNIKLEFQSTVQCLETVFDQDKVEKILFNLLSNAFKFTPESGAVSVHVMVTKIDETHFLKIDVKDTGIGIADDKLDKIFERFFQSDQPKRIINQGSGIGLAITKEFVTIHGGHIEVKSEPGRGSCFTVFLRVDEIIHPAENQPSGVAMSIQVNRESPEAEKHEETETPGQISNTQKKKSLLLVEDNDDFRFYLKDNLKFSYTIYEARNGMEGWTQALSIQPDLIVSDIMMPEMNGIELCKKIKNDERVSHIPIVLLTARGDEEQRIEGFETGAEEYIAKPFNFEILEARIKNLIQQREKSQRVFRKTLDVKASELQITSLDTKFIENAVKCVEKNISSPDFSVEDLGQELAISRAYLYKKMLALTGKSPLEFIRTIRLQHAAQLLEKSQLSVREVAYKVGFNTPKYFTRYFKEEYNVLPSNYAASRRKDE